MTALTSHSSRCFAMLRTRACACSAWRTAVRTPPAMPAFARRGGTTWKDGKVSPPIRRVKIAQGSDVRLLVTSDVDEELHVHGYDIRQDLPAGQQATLDFIADETGVFEVETEKNGLELVQLEVR